MPWRQKLGKGVSWNTALGELNLLQMIMKEAVAREMVEKNVLLDHGLKGTAPAKEKNVWTPHQLATVEQVTRERFGLFSDMHVMFQLGSKQACRSQQCQPKTRNVNFNNGTIFYDAKIMKGGKDFIQPIWRPSLPFLRELVDHCKAHGKARVCRWDDQSSFHWSDLTKELGFRTGDPETDICFHGLRTTWATNAAKARVPEAFTMEFLNHHSVEVHQIYQKFMPKDLRGELDRFADEMGL